MDLRNSEISCGVRELCGVRNNSPQVVLENALASYFDRYEKLRLDYINFGIIMFSDRMNPRHKNSKYYPNSGAGFAAFIEKEKLGKIINSNIITNPNTGNKIRVWLWQLNRKALVTWFNKNVYDDSEDHVRPEESTEWWR